MTQCNTQLHFPFFERSPLVASFTGGQVTSDAGLLLIRQFDEQIRFTKTLAAKIPDPPSPFFGQHSQLELLRQRIYQILAGYEDCNDATRSRHDPIVKLVVGRKPEDEPLASPPTLSRLENRVGHATNKDLIETFVRIFIATRSEPPKRITLEVDPTDFETHGHQQLTFFHGYYDQHMYFPLVLCDADTGFLLTPVLRPGNSGPAAGVLLTLEMVVRLLRAAWPGVQIHFRADSTLADPDLLRWLDEQWIPYAIGIGPNAVLDHLSAAFVDRVKAQFDATGTDQRCFTSLRYAAETWDHPRRVLVKCEVTSRGTNVRYVIVTRRGRSEDLYEWYVQRGETIEYYIEQLKNGFRGDRMSCQTFEANPFRFILYTAAYNLMVLFREHTTIPDVQHMEMNTIRVKLIKVGAVVRQTVRRVWGELSRSWPFAPIFRAAHAVLVPGPAG